MILRPFLLASLLTLAAPLALAAQPDNARALTIAQQQACLACHGVDYMVVGPSYQDVAARYKNDPAALERLFHKVRNGGSGVWGQVAMPANTTISDADLRTVLDWILSGAKKS